MAYCSPGFPHRRPKPTCYLGAAVARLNTHYTSEAKEGPLFGEMEASAGQPLVGRAPRGSGQGSSRQRALQGRGTALPAWGTRPDTAGQLPQLLEMEIGLSHCLLLFKAFALPQFHHILNSWAAHAASQLLDLEGRQPHAHGWTQAEPARRARRWKWPWSHPVPDINGRNK